MNKQEEITSGDRGTGWEWVIVWEHKGVVTYALRPVIVSYWRY